MLWWRFGGRLSGVCESGVSKYHNCPIIISADSHRSVALISGSVNHDNPGNQFGHPAAIFTFLFLAITAVSQIICLNRGLKVYDSTLVVPVFYGVYTAAG